MESPRIFLSPPHMGSRELELLREAFASNWIAPLGPQVDAFEREFAERVGSTHAVALSSGTGALHLALRIAGLKAGEEVFCSSLTFSASVNPIVYEQGRPVFIDSERRSWNMDPARLDEALRDRARKGKPPRAVILVHLYGQSADLAAVAELCDHHGVTLIEDAAESLGATYQPHYDDPVKARETPAISPGTRGRMGIFSFNGNKIITTSGGGMLVSPEASVAAKARFLATQARDPAPHYQHSEIGYNYRMSNLLAAVGRGQLEVLSERVASRRSNFAYYRSALADLPGIDFMPEAPWGLSSRWLTCILVDREKFGADREDVRRGCLSDNIEVRPVWKPMHQQPVFAGSDCFGGEVAEGLFSRGLCLPSGSSLTQAERERVVAAIRRSWRKLSG